MRKIIFSIIAFFVCISVHAQGVYIDDSWTHLDGIISPTSTVDFVGVGTSNPLSRVSVTGTGVTGKNPDHYTPSTQQKSQTVAVQGNGSAYFYAEDVTNDVETAMGASTTGDGFIGTLSSDNLDIRTNNTSRIMVTSGGNVGVGTSSPSSKLQVNGNISASNLSGTNTGDQTCATTSGCVVGAITGNQAITLSGDASGSGTTAITVAVSDDSHAHTGSTISGLSTVDFTSANISQWVNNAGYATTSYVDTGLSGKQATLVSGTNIKTINGSSVLGSGDLTVSGGGSGTVSNGTSGYLAVYTGSTTVDDTPVIYTNGTNVGIGTSVPTNTLTVKADSNNIGLSLFNPYTAGTKVANLYSSSGSGVLDLFATNGTDVNAKISGQGVSYLNAGNVGINTLTPAARLHVAGTGSTDYIQSDIGLNLQQVIAPATAPTATLVASAGNVNVGDHRYLVTYYTAIGETGRGAQSNTITASAGNQQVNLTSIPVSTDYRVVGRKIYRTKAGGSIYDFFLVTTIADNTTTTYTDNIADASLGTINAWWLVNTTNKMISLNGSKVMVIDDFNTVFGKSAGLNATGPNNVLFGTAAGKGVTTGIGNVAMGSNSCQNITTGTGNVCIGDNAGYGLDGNSSYNIIMGQYSAYLPAAANSNIVLGGSMMTSGGYTLGSYNVYVGRSSGDRSLGSSNVMIGNSAGSRETGGSSLYIDNQDRGTEALGKTNALIYGQFSATPSNQQLTVNAGKLTTTGNIGIGTTTPASSIHTANKVVDLAGAATVASVLRSTASAQENSTATSGAGLKIASAGHATATNNIITFSTEETNSQYTPTERMRIDSNGNVGIGTSSPTTKLHVVGNATISGKTTSDGVALKPPTTITVCSSTAMGNDACDYLCDGTADDVQIQAAINAIEATGIGGKLNLSEGDFIISSGITLHAGNIFIQGLGMNVTFIKTPVSSTFNWFTFTNNTATQYAVYMKDFTAYGYNSTGTFFNFKGGSAELWDTVFEDIYFDGFAGTTNPVLDVQPAWGKRFNRLIMEQAWGGAPMIKVRAGTQGSDMQITNCKIINNLGQAVRLESGVKEALISGNEFGAGSISGNSIYAPSTPSVLLIGSDSNRITNNSFALSRGVSLDGSSDGNLITNSTFDGAGAADRAVVIGSGALYNGVIGNNFGAYTTAEIADSGTETRKIGNYSLSGVNTTDVNTFPKTFATDGNEDIAIDVFQHTITAGDISTGYFVESWSKATATNVVSITGQYYNSGTGLSKSAIGAFAVTSSNTLGSYNTHSEFATGDVWTITVIYRK